MDKIISEIKQKWSVPASTPKTTEPFRLACTINNRIEKFSNPFPRRLPKELTNWWSKVENAVLFEDVDYGQWGLKILNEKESHKQSLECMKDEDYIFTDIIIGNFLGDLDLVLFSCEESEFGNIIISTPIDKRKDGYFLKMNFEEFLNKYIENEGDKFWEN